jgi:putative effector of murein hydrolase
MKLELMPVFWLALTLGAYFFSRWIYRRTGRYLLSPLILVPALLLAVAVPCTPPMPNTPATPTG